MTKEHAEKKQQIEKILAHATGSETLHRYTLSYGVTDGIKALCEVAGCYWLIDLIISHQVKASVKAESFQTWELTVANDRGVAQATDGNNRIIATQKIPYTDFPLDKIKLYLINKTILLPSEY